MTARYGMVIDLKKCIGCHTCTIACKVENGTRPGIFWMLVLDQETHNYPLVRRSFVPRLCMHCENAPCVEVCPSKASYRREDGIVLVDQTKCVGCKQCILSCPYGARYHNKDKHGYFRGGLTPNEVLAYSGHEFGVVEKCTLCVDKIEKGMEPACATACLVKAITFGDLSDSYSEVSWLIRQRHGFQFLKELGTEPSVYYLPP